MTTIAGAGASSAYGSRDTTRTSEACPAARSLDTATKARTLFVGHRETSAALEAAIHSEAPSLSGKVEILEDPLLTVAPFDKEDAVFGRDLRVTLLDGSQFLPYCFVHHPGPENVQGLFPIRSLLDSVPTSSGFGFHKEFKGIALETAAKAGIPHRSAKTCIEGGNCFLFHGPDGLGRAIVGTNSLILSLLALEEQHYFDENRAALEERMASIETPSDEFLLMARDRPLFEEKASLERQLLKLHELIKTDPKYRAQHAEVYHRLTEEFTGPGATYKAKLARPPSVADRASFIKEAKELQAKWDMTKELIADELKIPFEKGKVDERVAFVLQNEFHIDLEMFVGPHGKIIVNDEAQVHETCVSTRVAPKYRAQQAAYISKSESRLTASGHLKALNAPILARLGCEVVYAPGYFHGEAAASPSVNFLNGLVFGEAGAHHFATLAATDRAGITDSFQEAFRERMHRVAPDLHLIFVNTVENVFSERGGGLHCLTWEIL